MRDPYYADDRDLVKWGVLVEVAARHKVRHVLQVLYYRPSEWPYLEIDGERVALPDTVRRHFRDTAAICKLECSARIEVVQDAFIDRNRYLEVVLRRVEARTELPGIVFLDPDTGLEPQVPGPEHVLASEITSIWRVMSEGDVLVLYQHQTNRNGRPWIQPKKIQFAQAVSLKVEDLGVAGSPGIAADVVFFFARKHAAVSKTDRHAVAVESAESGGTTLQDVLDCLSAAKTRATYGAVAAVVGGLARGVGQRLGARRPEASWVVSSSSGLPTGYEPSEMHPALVGTPLITTADELEALVRRCRSGSL